VTVVATDRAGLLIIRAWVERGSAKPLRAQIRLTTDVAAGLESELTLVDASRVCAVVESWLLDVLAEALPDEVGPIA
jgi:hypothetical protein